MVKDGIVLGKRYAVLSKIGAGGMADVYKGRDQMLNRYRSEEHTSELQ